VPDLTGEELLGRIRLHGRIPRHVAIIMDGNGRWARDRVMPRTYGHRAGMQSVREVVEADALDEHGVRVRVLGEIERLTPPAAAAVARVTAQTAANDRLALNLFISYGARAELVRAARSLAEDVAAGRLSPGQIDEAAFEGRLYTAGMVDPDLLIRTSGEQRISNFMLWQLAYTELYVSPVLWPDFRRPQFYEAILAFQARDRRFGRVTV